MPDGRATSGPVRPHHVESPAAAASGPSEGAARISADAEGGASANPPNVITAAQRTAALEAGAPRVPRNVIIWGFIAAACLALGGTLAEHIFSAEGLNASATIATPTTSTTLPVETEPTTGPLAASGALLALQRLKPVAAPPFRLLDQHGQVVSLQGERGKVVVLTFFDASCNDSCPVIAAELRRANDDLGALRSRVIFLTVNTDPLDLAVAPSPPAVTKSGLASLSNWYFLTGSVRQLNPLWNDLGVSISVYVDERAVVHNDLLYFIDPKGRLVVRGSPFSDESRNGGFTLPAPLVRVAGRGIATAVSVLLGDHS